MKLNNREVIAVDVPDDDFQETEFMPCDKCDGHAACEDFGCAFDLGKGNMVKKKGEPGSEEFDWNN